MEAQQERKRVPKPAASSTVGICSTLASALWQVGLGDDPALGCHALGGHCPTCSGTPLMPSLKPWLHLLSQHHPGGLWQRIAALSHPQPLLVLHQPTGLAWTIQKHIVPYQVLQELLYFQLLSSSLKPEAFLMLLLCLQELLSCVFLFLPPESSLCFQLTLQALHFSCKHDQQQESEPLLTLRTSGPFSASSPTTPQKLCGQRQLYRVLSFSRQGQHHKQSTRGSHLLSPPWPV